MGVRSDRGAEITLEEQKHHCTSTSVSRLWIWDKRRRRADKGDHSKFICLRFLSSSIVHYWASLVLKAPFVLIPLNVAASCFKFLARHLLPLLQPYSQQLSWETGALFASSAPSLPSSCSIWCRLHLLTPMKSSIWRDADLSTLMGTQVTLSWRFSRMPHFVSI